MKRNVGFTLVELMIVVAVIGVLAAIAIPQYDSYVRKSKRSEAKIALVTIAQLQESYFANNNRYALELGSSDLGLNCAKKGVCKTASGFIGTTIDSNYGLTLLITAGTNGFTIMADAASPSQLKDTQCLRFALDSRGRKTAGAAAGNAVPVGDPNNCW